MSARALLLASLFAASAARGAGAPPGPPAVHAEILPDGSELIVLRVAGARRASLRYVVRAGSAWDPPGKAGLAHLVEHAIASAHEGSSRLIEEVEAAGGTMNAFTSRDATWYALDAPAPRFAPLAAKLLGAVTNPRFDRGDVAATQGTVDAEQDGARSGLLAEVEAVVFPDPVGTGLGTTGTRQAVTREDLVGFYRARYVTAATTVVVAGDLTPAAVRALVEGATALPPALPSERYAPRRAAPSLPAELDSRARVHAVVVGFELAEADGEACETAAELLTVRLTRECVIDRPFVSSLSVGCTRMRGVPFLLTAAFARTLSGDKGLPQIIDAAYRRVVEQPMTDAERRMLVQRRSRTLDWRHDSPERSADDAAALASAPRDDGPTPIARLETPVATPAEVRAFARRTFVPERRLRVTFTPY